jgi:beta-glucanase (GH16 family)
VLSAGSVADNFHTYAVQWDSTHVFFFVDDALHYQVTRGGVEQYGRSILGNSFIVILNLAVGGHFDGDPASDAIFPATMTVDYVRVFKSETK